MNFLVCTEYLPGLSDQIQLHIQAVKTVEKNIIDDTPFPKVLDALFDINELGIQNILKFDRKKKRALILPLKIVNGCAGNAHHFCKNGVKFGNS
jgi:hypothetical protein